MASGPGASHVVTANDVFAKPLHHFSHGTKAMSSSLPIDQLFTLHVLPLSSWSDQDTGVAPEP